MEIGDARLLPQHQPQPPQHQASSKAETSHAAFAAGCRTGQLAPIDLDSEEVVAANALDIAKRVLGRQRQLLDTSVGSGRKLRTGNAAPESFVKPSHGANDTFGFNEVSDAAKLADHLAVQLSNFSRHLEVERREVERRLEHLEKYVDTRLHKLENAVSNPERRPPSEPSNEQQAVSQADVSRIIRESRALVSGAVAEVQAVCKAQRAEMQATVEAKGSEFQRGLEELREIKQDMDKRAQARDSTVPPPWFGELESAVAALEHRLSDHRSATDAQIARLQTEVEGSKIHLAGLQEQIVHSVQSRLTLELEKFAATSAMLPSATEQTREAGTSSRRLNDVESRLAALRVRVDVHESRLGSMGDRVEGLCQQALEEAREVALQQREVILSEVDCRQKVLLQHLSPEGRAGDGDDSLFTSGFPMSMSKGVRRAVSPRVC